jgi:outer membrane lipoprotein carrier protein
MRWDYYKSESLADRKKTLVSDGKVFWVYELEFQQVFKQCLAKSQLPTSLKFLMGQGNLLEDFDVSFADGSSKETPQLALVPKKPTPKYKKVHFQVDPETFQVDKTTVFDPYGNTNAIDFQKTKLNKNLPDSGFAFEPPEGARMLNPQKECSS